MGEGGEDKIYTQACIRVGRDVQNSLGGVSMKKPMKQTIGDFLAGRGFYIVLFLCVAAIGVSGWYLMQEIALPGGAPVGGQAVVKVTPTPSVSPVVTPAPPVVSPTPKPTPQPTPKPSPAPTPTPTPKATDTLSQWGSDVYTWPVKGTIISDFSLEVLAYDETLGDWRVHEGLDVAAELGASVKAVNAGTVSGVYQDDLMGTVVTIAHGEGLTSLYANLAAQPTVEVGDEISTGDVIGTVGETAIAEIAKPAHLHFEMAKDGQMVDPITYLPPQ